MFSRHAKIILLTLIMTMGLFGCQSANAADNHQHAAPHAVAHGPVGHAGPGVHGPGGHGFDRGGHGFAGHGEHGRDFHHFGAHDWHHMNDYDRRMWRGGSWVQESFNGMYGWWWMVGGMRYFYPQPIYPYPTVVATTMFEGPGVAVVPVATAPVTPAQMTYTPAQQQVRYYCPGVGYAPQVQSCPGGWVTKPM